jgi:translation initiation factor 4E
VVTFDSVEEFWGVYVSSFTVIVLHIANKTAQNNITACSDLGLKSDYHLFKKGVRPEWEDAQNKHGGKWSYQFKDKRAVNIDELWLHAQLAAIGETLEEEDDNEVMGVVVNVRKGFYRIGLWTRTVGKSKGDNASGKDVLLKIGTNFKEVLKLGPNDLMEFSGHTDSAHAGSTRAKAKYTV